MFRKKYNENGGVFRSKTNINFANTFTSMCRKLPIIKIMAAYLQ